MTTPKSIKVNVPVKTLIQAAEKEREQIVKKWDADMKKYDAGVVKWGRSAVLALQAAADEISDGPVPVEKIGHSYKSSANTSIFEVTVKAARPNPVPMRPSTDAVDRDLALLLACSNDELAISTGDNFAKYLIQDQT